MIQAATKNVKFQLTQQHKDLIFEINENLAGAAKLSLRLPLPDKRFVIMCDASEHAAGYVLLIEDYTETNDGPMKSKNEVKMNLPKAKCH